MSVLTDTPTLCKYARAVRILRDLPGYDNEDEAEIARWENRDRPAAQIGRRLRATSQTLGLKPLMVSTTLIKEHRLGDCGCRVDI